MKVTEHIAKAQGKTLFSLEVLPPVKGQNINSIFDTIDAVIDFKPAFVDVTYHREEFVYKKHPNGLLEKKSVRKRPGTVGISAAILNRYGIDPVPHIICGGFSREETENALIDLNFLGVDNVLVLRGDPIKSEGTFKAEPDGHAYAIDLLKQVIDLNNGKYLDEEITNSTATNFCAGVAGYPEKHFEAANMKSDIHFLKKKVEAGAEFIVTQMFFDNKYYFDFVDLCRKNGINVPIIPGLKPFATKKQLVSIPKNFFIDLPEALVDEVVKCKTSESVYELGVEWCINQCKELIKEGAPVLHFYSMSKVENIKKVAEGIF
ncbi:MAG: methylenetetrahydrofolate reductase [Luteibaculaceae bacterium]